MKTDGKAAPEQRLLAAEESLAPTLALPEAPVPALAPADGHYVLDRAWHILSMNEVALDYLGTTRQEAIGKTLWQLAPGLIGSHCEAYYRDAMERHERAEFVGPSAVRPGRWLEARIFPAEIGLHVFLRDVTERVELETKLQESEERLRLAQEAGGIGLWDWNIASGHVVWSESYYRVWGIDPSVGPSIEAFLASVHPEQREEIKARFERALADAGPGRLKFAWLAKARRAGSRRGASSGRMPSGSPSG